MNSPFCAIRFSTGKHENIRYKELLPRLRMVEEHRFKVSSFPPLRKLQVHVAKSSASKLLRTEIGHRYQALLATDTRGFKWHAMARNCNGPVVIDLDDPLFTESELAAIGLPNVVAVIATTNEMRDRLIRLGVKKFISVQPQPILDAFFEVEKEKSDSEAVKVGLAMPRLMLEEEAGPVPRHSVTELLRSVERARGHVPGLELELVGRPTARLRRLASKLPWLRLHGYVDHAMVPSIYSRWDIATYGKRHQHNREGWSPIKIGEYMAVGLPIVATDEDEARVIEEIGAGRCVANESEFSEAIVDLAKADGLREEMGRRGKNHVRERKLSRLTMQYDEVLNDLLKCV